MKFLRERDLRRWRHHTPKEEQMHELCCSLPGRSRSPMSSWPCRINGVTWSFCLSSVSSFSCASSSSRVEARSLHHFLLIVLHFRQTLSCLSPRHSRWLRTSWLLPIPAAGRHGRRRERNDDRGNAGPLLRYCAPFLRRLRARITRVP